MEFRVLSHHAASVYSPSKYGHERAVIVRITSLPTFYPLEHADEFADVICFNFDDIFPVTLNDMDPEHAARMVVFNDEHAAQLVEFFDRWNNNCDVFIVHCDAGVSRSSATAIALAEYGGQLSEYERLLNDRRYSPNMHVLSTIRRVTGWVDQRQQALNDVFGG